MTRLIRYGLKLAVIAAVLVLPAAAQVKRTPFDVTKYVMDVNLAPENRKLTASVDVTFTPLEDTRSVAFELNGSLKIDTVTRVAQMLTGAPVSGPMPRGSVKTATPPASAITFVQDQTNSSDLGPHVRIDLGDNVVKGTPVTLRFRYSGVLDNPAGGPLLNKRLAYVGETQGYLMYAARWFPFHDYAADQATSEITISLPAGLQLVGTSDAPVTAVGGKYKFIQSTPGLPGNFAYGKYMPRTLRVGDPFIVGQFSGKVRAMISDRGESVTEASPATPVEILGLQGVPQAGDTFQVVADVERAQDIAQQRQMHARQAAMLKTTKRGIESLGQAEIKELLVVLKADVQGSVEVLRSTLEKLSTEKVKVRVIRAGVGAINESDVLLASATQTEETGTAVVIIGFNVRPEARAADVARQEEVDIRLHSIIYKVEEEITAAMIGMLDAIEKEAILGKVVVQETFKVSRIGTIAGCRVIDGVIRRQAKARLIRDGVVIWDGDIATLKRFKDDVNEVKNGFECGMSLVNFNDIKVNDEIEAFVIEKIAATEL